MKTQMDWGWLSVQEFFSQSNWQGKPLEQVVEGGNPFSESAWLGLSVQDFFNQSNWEGKAQNCTQPTHTALSLTLSVSQFFELMDWEGQPQIAVPPQKKTGARPPDPSAQNMTLSDLSDLF
jgi:hypothetical protein